MENNIKNEEQNCLIFLKKNLMRLSLPFEQQYLKIEDFAKYNLANDLVSDWENYEQVVDFLEKVSVLDKSVVDLLHKLVANFDKVSYGAPKYQKVIWTIEGLENHPFWQEQRKLAQTILDKLEKD